MLGARLLGWVCALWCLLGRAASLQCPELSVAVPQSNNTCYHLNTTTRTWEEAESECQRLGGHLAVIDSAEKQTILEELVEQNGAESVWIGGKEGEELHWHWEPGNELLRSQGCFFDLVSARDLSYAAPHMTSLTLERCFTECRRNNYTFAGLQGGSSCFCDNQFGRYGIGDTCYTQCSGDYTAICGGWDRNNVYALNGSFDVWGDVQPDNFDGNEACASLGRGSQYYQYDYMKDDDCQLNKHYVCFTPSDSCYGATGGHYVSLADGCYFIGTTTMTWFTAQLDCAARGGSLVKLKDEYQHQTVKNFMSWYAHEYLGDIWIGATRKHIQWHTGLEMEFTNWAPGYPSSSGGDCVRLARSLDNQWLDVDCSTQNMFVCESEPVSTTTQPTTIASTSTPTSPTSPTSPSSVGQSLGSGDLHGSTTLSNTATTTSQSVSSPGNPVSTSSSSLPGGAQRSTDAANGRLKVFEIALCIAAGVLLIVLSVSVYLIVRHIKRNSKSRVHPDEKDRTSRASDQISVVDLTASKPPMDKKNMFSGSVWDTSSRKSSHSNLIHPSDVELSTPDLISRPGQPMILAMPLEPLAPVHHRKKRKCPVCQERVRKVRAHLIIIHKMAPGSTELRFALKTYKRLRAEKKAAKKAQSTLVRPATS